MNWYRALLEAMGITTIGVPTWQLLFGTFTIILLAVVIGAVFRLLYCWWKTRNAQIREEAANANLRAAQAEIAAAKASTEGDLQRIRADREKQIAELEKDTRLAEAEARKADALRQAAEAKGEQNRELTQLRQRCAELDLALGRAKETATNAKADAEAADGRFREAEQRSKHYMVENDELHQELTRLKREVEEFKRRVHIDDRLARLEAMLKAATISGSPSSTPASAIPVLPEAVTAPAPIAMESAPPPLARAATGSVGPGRRTT